MSIQPTILTTFANDKTSHLPLLERECREIKSKLEPLAKRGFIKIKQIPDLTSDDPEKKSGITTNKFLKLISKFEKDIVIFHYGGHANRKSLQFENGLAFSDGLAGIMGSLPNLKLVFLNGCSTKDMVQKMLDRKVPAVIGTSVPIEDKTAVAFAEAFYQALANKYSLRHAFVFAYNAIQTLFEETPEVEAPRGVVLRHSGIKEGTPWQFKVQPENAADIMTWQLPYYRKTTVIPKGFIPGVGAQPNWYLLSVLEEMCRFNKDIYTEMVETVKGTERKKDTSTFFDIIVKNFPWIIGAQLKLLHVIEHRKFNKERLQHLISTYLVSSQLLYFILFSDIWDMQQKGIPDLPKGFLKQHRLSKENILQTDFLQQILALFDLGNSKLQGFFMPEIYPFCAELKKGNSSLDKAHQYLERLRLGFKGISKEDMKIVCINAEKSLTILLKKMAFLCNYKMLTLRGINIDNPRHQKLEYELEMGALNASHGDKLTIYEDPEFRRKDDYAQCKSIIIVANEDEMGHFINLSPFVIDYHTFMEKDNLDPHLYAYELDRTYYYYAVKHNIFRSLEDKKKTGLIHTKLSTIDHEEGYDRKEKNSLAADLNFDELEEQENYEQTANQAMLLLENQFERLKTDFLP